MAGARQGSGVGAEAEEATQQGRLGGLARKAMRGLWLSPSE